jgi:UDP-3-O-[3-hydroxymyristoyl] glucosamine N-acyltransferase
MSKNISSKKIIEYLKKIKIYYNDNNIKNTINSISNLEHSSYRSISWIGKHSYSLSSLKSNIIIAPINFKDKSSTKTIIQTVNPQLAMAYLINNFFPSKVNNFVSKKSSINKNAKLGKNIYIGDNVVISQNCIIGDNTKIYPNCVIFSNTVIGSNVIINSGSRIGQEGFGYIKDLTGKHIQFPHIGKVIIENNVEIGANTCIDRGSLSNTIIGENTKINNLCHIAHNVKIGKNSLIAAKVAICGSVLIGNNVFIGTNASIMNGISIKNNVTIGMGSVVTKNISYRKIVYGNPARVRGV